MKHSSLSESDPRARPKPFTFYPPRNNRLVTGLVKRMIRRAIRRKLRVEDVEISDDDLDCLRRLKGQRCLLAPSHSGGFEPHIIMYLSKLLKVDCNYVAAIELFEQSPVYRWLMPRLGVYSIVRGAVDRPSFSKTRELLAAGERWLVIFPEGQTIWQNSMVIPFQEGVFQLAFKGFEDATKNGADAHLFCVPIAIKYIYLEDMHSEIDQSLDRLEVRLCVESAGESLSRYARLRRIAEAVLVANEQVHQATVDPEWDMNRRIENIKEHVISEIERELGVNPSSKQSLLDRIRSLFNAVDRIVHEEATGSEYLQQLQAERQNAVRMHYEDLWRLLQFVAIYDGSVRESMTVERFMDVLCLLEMEVLRARRMWGPRKASVRVGEPVDLADYAKAYEENKRNTVREVTLTIESSVREMLDELGRDCPRVVDSVAAGSPVNN